ERIDCLSQTGRLVERLAVGVADHELQWSGAVTEIDLKSVVVRIRDGFLVSDGGELRAEGRPRPLNPRARKGGVGAAFTEGTAGRGAWLDIIRLTQAQAEGRISWVCRGERQQMVRLRTDIIDAEDGLRGNFTLQ